MAEENKYLQGQPDPSELKSLSDKLKEARQKAATPADYAEIEQQEQEAQRLYNERADRAEWLSLADRIGNALVRYGAAQSGLKSGVDMTQINYGPGYDQKAAQERAARDYEMTLGSLGRKRGALKDLSAAEQAKLDREARAAEVPYETEKYLLGQHTDTYQQRLRDDEAFRRRQAELETQAARDRAREEREAKRTETAADKQLQAQRYGDLQKELKQARDEEAAAAQAAQVLASQKDLGKKSAEKVMTSYPGIMAKAGITPEQMSSIQERATEKGWIWDSIDEKKRQQLIQEEIIKPKQEQVKNLRQALDSLLQKKEPGAAAPMESPVTSPAAPAGAVRMRAPNGAIGSIPADKVKDAEAKGFTRVD